MELTPVLDGISSGGALGVAGLVIWALLSGQLFTKSAMEDKQRQLDQAMAERDRMRDADDRHHRT